MLMLKGASKGIVKKMDPTNIVLTVMIAGFSLNFGLMFIIWKSLNQRIDQVNDRIDKLCEKVEDIDRRLCRIEGSLSSQGHCLFHQSQSEKKVE